MSCNGCRVLRKGCSENCVLRQCLQCIDSPQAQGYATIFVAKFFGRAGLMSFISSVPEIQRPALFQSLLFEAVGRAINPVNGAVGLLWTGNWHVCQSAVETVLRGGAIRPLPELVGEDSTLESDIASEGADHSFSQQVCTDSRSNKPLKRKVCDDVAKCQPSDLDLCLVLGLPETMAGGGGFGGGMRYGKEKRRAATPSEESGTTTLGSGSSIKQGQGDEGKLLIFI